VDLAQADRMTTFGHCGRWITHPDGRIAVLRGFNLVNKVSPYHLTAMSFDERHAGFIARHGFNAIRTGIIWKALEPRPGCYDDVYLDCVRETIRLCHRHGLHVLLDFHQDMANERFGGEGWPDWRWAPAPRRLGPISASRGTTLCNPPSSGPSIASGPTIRLPTAWVSRTTMPPRGAMSLGICVTKAGSSATTS
jgi:hypothetical protein